VIARFLIATTLLLGASGAWARNVFDRLRHVRDVDERRLQKPVSAAERQLLREVTRLPAKGLILPGAGDRRYHVRLRGSIRQYVGAIVTPRDTPDFSGSNTQVGFVDCPGVRAHRCVAILGGPCSQKDARIHGEECEGMYLTVTIDVTASPPSLDRIIGGGYYEASNQDDIEDLLAEAP
jgi:hypothetical protein